MQSPINTTKKTITYELMHMDKVVATVSTLGQAKNLNEQFMPYDISLEESNDFEELLNNLANFFRWCVTRVLSLDRTYAKQIMNSLGVPQAVTDRDVDLTIFDGMDQEREMFLRRLAELKKYAKES